MIETSSNCSVDKRLVFILEVGAVGGIDRLIFVTGEQVGIEGWLGNHGQDAASCRFQRNNCTLSVAKRIPGGSLQFWIQAQLNRGSSHRVSIEKRVDLFKELR